MDPERWQRVKDRFHELADLPAAERDAALSAEPDPGVAHEVRRMLAADAAAHPLLDGGLAEVAGGMLAEDDGGGVAAGREIGPYRLEHVLGEGGMGVVWRATRRELGGHAAVKVLRDAWLSPARRARFASEQRTLAQLSHPAIAQLHDAGTLADGTPWFAMEHVEGEPITRYCGRHRCDVRRRLAIFREVCEAVLHAHQRAVIHRDLKPSNVLVAEGDRVKLLDFGIAKTLDDTGGEGPVTRTGLHLMTPAYAAPEQLAGGALGVHTDVYALGIMLYELLTGAPPFSEAPAGAVRGEPERPSLRAARVKEAAGGLAPVQVGRDAWADLDVLCGTAMQNEPARRYRTVDSLIRDVDHFLRGEPLEARPDSLGYRAGKFVRRNRAAVLAVTAGVVALATLAGFYTARLRTARNAALLEAERTRHVQEFMVRLFEGGDPDVGPADTLRVVTLLAAGVREARTLSAQPAIRAELEFTLASIYQELGALEQADTLFGSALAIRSALRPEPAADIATTLAAIALLRADQSRLEEADSLARAALALQARARAGPAATARATTALGRVLEARGDYAEAIATLEQAARLDSIAGSPPRIVAQTLTELANCYFYAGDYAHSDSLNHVVLAIDRAEHGPAHPSVASDLINLGAIQQELGRYTAAESLYREALTIYRGWFGEEHFETAATLTMIGRALLFAERLPEADSALHRALAIRERVYGPNHPMVASTLNEVGRLAQQRGHLDQAERDFRRVLAIYREAFADRHYLVGVALANLAGISIARKRGAEAEPLLRDAIRRFRELLGDDHLHTGITRIKLGRALLLQKRYAEAVVESRAGLDIVAAQTDPAVGWLDNARTDLAAAYTALGREADAATFRAALGSRPPK